MSDRRSDRELVARVQGGDRRAFDLLVIKYQHKVAGLISRYIRDPGETMDVAQEAFLKAYRALPGFRGESAFYTWLYRIVINTVKNHLIARGRRPPGDDLEADVAEQLEAGGRLRDPATPEHHLLSMEIAGTVQAALDGLPEDLRAAILLREIEGLSYEEIATAMECPVGTVRSRIFRAREAIDKRLIAAWEGYHLIGAAMRSERIRPEYRRIGARVSERIAAGPPLRRRRVRRGWIPRLGPLAGAALAACAVSAVIVAAP